MIQLSLKVQDRCQVAGEGRRRQVSVLRILVLVWWLPLFFAACATPVAVSRVSEQEVDRELTSYALTGGKPSAISQIMLSRYNLLELYDRAPEEVLLRLHGVYVEGDRIVSRDVAFAIAELSFLYAEQTHQRSYYLTSALYAYAFLFPESAEEAPSPFDRRFRQACDLYNRALTDGLKSEDGETVELRASSYALPFGQLDVEFKEDQLIWDQRRLGHFIPGAELKIEGMRNHYRVPGIGAPLVASHALPMKEQKFMVAPKLHVPATALLRVEQPRRQLATGTVRASLELHVTLDTTSVQIGWRQVPLELESTAFIAATLQESPIWERELKGFFMGEMATRTMNAYLVGVEPYRPGRFPVVFVHGTASSPGRWADMVNDLLNDRRLRTRFQFWFFGYNTGNPVAYSAMLLRDEMEKALRTLDPDGRDPALQHMVVIGHSQGGLLTKLTAVKTDDRLWNKVFKKPIDQMDIAEDEKTLFRRALFVEPVPSVRRVVFIATPHRGSFMAKTWIGKFLGNLVKLPGTITTALSDASTREKEAFLIDPSLRTLGSGFGMTPGSPVMNELSRIPVSPDIAAHSIIAVEGSGPIEEGDDGVVQYTSAHIDGVASEKVVASPHSTQSNPETIEEVRRILLLHAEKWCGHEVLCEPNGGMAAGQP